MARRRNNPRTEAEELRRWERLYQAHLNELDSKRRGDARYDMLAPSKVKKKAPRKSTRKAQQKAKEVAESYGPDWERVKHILRNFGTAQLVEAVGNRGTLGKAAQDELDRRGRGPDGKKIYAKPNGRARKNSGRRDARVYANWTSYPEYSYEQFYRENPSKWEDASLHDVVEVSYIEWSSGENRRASKQRFSSFDAAEKSAKRWLKKQGARWPIVDGLATSDDGLRTSVQVMDDTRADNSGYLKAVAFIEWPSYLPLPIPGLGRRTGYSKKNPSKRGKTRQPALLPVPHSVKPGKKSNAEWVYARNNEGRFKKKMFKPQQIILYYWGEDPETANIFILSNHPNFKRAFKQAVAQMGQPDGAHVVTARRNGGLKLGKAVYDEMPTNAGPYLPQIFPYGQGGRPATYER